MNDFDYDVMQKKSIARGAAHRKRGARSQKCRLPSDYLTKKELRALNGEVKTYHIYQRLSWKQFKALPDDLAAEHIKYLVDTFGVNQDGIAQALDVGTATVRRYIQEHGIQLKRCRFNPATPEWCAFLGGGSEPVAEEPAPVECAPAVPSPAASVEFLRGTLSLTGPKGLVLQRLFEVLPDIVAVNEEA